MRRQIIDRRQWAERRRALFCDPAAVSGSSRRTSRPGKSEPMETTAGASGGGRAWSRPWSRTGRRKRTGPWRPGRSPASSPSRIESSNCSKGVRTGLEGAGVASIVHPFCLAIHLRQCLDDKTPTKTTYAIERATRWRGRASRRLRPLKFRRSSRSANPARAGDGAPCAILAAARSREMSSEGMPAFHPLLKDADERLARLKEESVRSERLIAWRQRPGATTSEPHPFPLATDVPVAGDPEPGKVTRRSTMHKPISRRGVRQRRWSGGGRRRQRRGPTAAAPARSSDAGPSFQDVNGNPHTLTGDALVQAD